MPQIADIAGQTFGRLIALDIDDHRSGRRKVWRCQCSCGRVSFATSANLRSGAVKSCGCLKVDSAKSRATHGESRRSAEYVAWAGMKSRCLNRNSEDWTDYGGRGISVCADWLEFQPFLLAMGRKPTPRHSLDRMNVHGNYEPSNCRWATPIEQSTNRRNRLAFTHQGRTLNLIEWQAVVGVHWRTLRSRITQMGWSVERALTTPAKR